MATPDERKPQVVQGLPWQTPTTLLPGAQQTGESLYKAMSKPVNLQGKAPPATAPVHLPSAEPQIWRACLLLLARHLPLPLFFSRPRLARLRFRLRRLQGLRLRPLLSSAMPPAQSLRRTCRGKCRRTGKTPRWPGAVNGMRLSSRC